MDLYVRQLRQTPGLRRNYVLSMITCCAVAGMLVAVSLDVVWQSRVSLEVLVGCVLGGGAGTLCLPFYGRHFRRMARRIAVAQGGSRLPMQGAPSGFERSVEPAASVVQAYPGAELRREFDACRNG